MAFNSSDDEMINVPFIIKSYEELQDFYNSNINSQVLSFDIFSNYDANYFEDKSLILYLSVERVENCKIDIDSVKIENDEMFVEMSRYVPSLNQVTTDFNISFLEVKTNAVFNNVVWNVRDTYEETIQDEIITDYTFTVYNKISINELGVFESKSGEVNVIKDYDEYLKFYASYADAVNWYTENDFDYDENFFQDNQLIIYTKYEPQRTNVYNMNSIQIKNGGLVIEMFDHHIYPSQEMFEPRFAILEISNKYKFNDVIWEVEYTDASPYESYYDDGVIE